jgi:hypothetical protein
LNNNSEGAIEFEAMNSESLHQMSANKRIYAKSIVRRAQSEIKSAPFSFNYLNKLGRLKFQSILTVMICLTPALTSTWIVTGGFSLYFMNFLILV